MSHAHRVGHLDDVFLSGAAYDIFCAVQRGHRLCVQSGVVKGRGLRLRFQRGRPSSGQALCRTASIRRAAGGRQGVCIRRGDRCFHRLRHSIPGRGRSSIPIPGRLIFAFFYFLLQVGPQVVGTAIFKEMFGNSVTQFFINLSQPVNAAFFHCVFTSEGIAGDTKRMVLLFAIYIFNPPAADQVRGNA